jgi:hypothetical protein
MTVTHDLSRFTFAVLLCLLASGCTGPAAPPKGTSITGESGGCGDFVAYRFNQDRTLAVVITVDGDEFELSEEPTPIALGPEITGVRVEVYRFEQPAGQYFCDDVGGDPEPIAKWTVTDGSISIIRKTGPPPANLSNATHKISAVMQKAKITHSTSGTTADFGDVRLDDVWVGWFAG